jgi:hypothetical protein
MATAECIKTISGTAGAAVPIYRFVAIQSDGKWDPVGSAQAIAHGVSAEEAAADGDVFAVALLGGKMKVELGATLAPGALVASDDTGKAIASVDSGGNYALGVVIAGGDSGEIGEVLLFTPFERDA